MENIVIGIEGFVGAGKTSICRELLKEIPNSVLLNGGNLYRAIISVLINQKKGLNQLRNLDIREIMKKLDIEIKIEDNETNFYYNGNRISEEKMQSLESSMAVSKVGGIANNTNLFIFARNLIDNLKKDYNVIVSGRALMQIYPEMDYHFFIVATLEQRILRKMKQYEGKMSKEELRQHIEKRDMLQEKAGFYQISPKTIKIDVTECKTAEESTKKLLQIIEGD